jgi:Protein of unknown function (DUF3626)
MRFPDGPIPRFGSCYLVLRRELLQRSSFTFMGSEVPNANHQIGTIDLIEPVFAPLLQEIEQSAVSRPPWPPFVAPTLGVPHLTVASLFDLLLNDLPKTRLNPRTQTPGRVLDTQVEAQVHGSINLKTDVELLVVDPAFANTATGAVLDDLSAKYSIPLQRHCGFRLHVKDVPSDFRGPAAHSCEERLLTIFYHRHRPGFPPCIN